MTKKSILGLSLCPDRFSLIAMEHGSVKAVSTRELVQPFDYDILRKAEEPLNSHVDILTDLYQRMDVSFKQVALVLNSDLVMIKKVPLALGLDEQISKQIIEWEADQMTVSPINQYIVDSDKLSFQTNNGNPIYLLVLIRKKIIQLVKQLVWRAGLKLSQIDVDVFTSVRTLKKNYDFDPDETILIVDMKTNYIELIIVHQNEYFLSHRIDHLDAGIRTAITDPKDISSIILKEIKRLLFGHRLGQSVDDLGKIYFMGNEISNHVMKEVANTVSVSVHMLNPFKRILITPEVTKSKDYLRYPEKFVSCLGVTV